MLQRIDLGDRVAIAAAPSLQVTGFAADTLVRDALTALAAAAGVEPRWRATIAKRIPVAAGLGGGSSDAATALRLANETLPRRCPASACAPSRPRSERTCRSSSRPGRSSAAATAPSSSRSSCRRTTGSSSRSRTAPARTRPRRSTGASTSATGREGWEERREALEQALAAVRRPRDLAALPPNDLASSPLAAELLRLGAFRADVSGAGPTVYGLFHHRRHAEAARRALRSAARTWLTVPAWYG